MDDYSPGLMTTLLRSDVSSKSWPRILCSLALLSTPLLTGNPWITFVAGTFGLTSLFVALQRSGERNARRFLLADPADRDNGEIKLSQLGRVHLQEFAWEHEFLEELLKRYWRLVESGKVY